jgi:hypothetical protein
MDGRDIGTVVFPHAEVKLFMTARPEVRAQRRYHGVEGLKGAEVDYASVVENIAATRSTTTMRRAADPFIKATDAIEIDNSDLTSEEQFVTWPWTIVVEVLARVGAGVIAQANSPRRHTFSNFSCSTAISSGCM